jgi:hypothetical protein
MLVGDSGRCAPTRAGCSVCAVRGQQPVVKGEGPGPGTEVPVNSQAPMRRRVKNRWTGGGRSFLRTVAQKANHLEDKPVSQLGAASVMAHSWRYEGYLPSPQTYDSWSCTTLFQERGPAKRGR